MPQPGIVLILSSGSEIFWPGTSPTETNKRGLTTDNLFLHTMLGNNQTILQLQIFLTYQSHNVLNERPSMVFTIYSWWYVAE